MMDPEHRVPCHCHALDNRYYLMAWGQTAGQALKWFKDNFCEKEAEQAMQLGIDVFEILSQQAESVAAGSEGLVFLPHLCGAACPEFDPNAKGVFFNISLVHKKQHFIRAIMESVAFMLKSNTDLLGASGMLPKELRCTGGGSRSRLWNTIKADVLQIPVKKVITSEAASVGVAIIGGVAVGIFKTIDDGCQSMVKLDDEILPNPQYKEIYETGFQIYRKLYDNLVELFSEIRA